MNLHKFSEDAGAATISAKALDFNFKKLSPLATGGYPRHYAMSFTEDGWSMTIFPQFPQASGALHVLGIQNGQLRWVPTTQC